MPLPEIASVNVTQSLLQRLFHVHTLKLTDQQGADLKLHVPFPNLITDLIPGHKDKTP